MVPLRSVVLGIPLEQPAGTRELHSHFACSGDPHDGYAQVGAIQPVRCSEIPTVGQNGIPPLEYVVVRLLSKRADRE